MFSRFRPTSDEPNAKKQKIGGDVYCEIVLPDVFSDITFHDILITYPKFQLDKVTTGGILFAWGSI